MSVKQKKQLLPISILTLCVVPILGIGIYFANTTSSNLTYFRNTDTVINTLPPKPTLDETAYDTRLLSLAHIATSTPWYTYFLTGTLPTTTITATTTATSTITTDITIPHEPWPTKTVYPDYGALLPFNRIVAYYGNFYSTKMGILGEFPEEEVISKLLVEKANWEKADPETPVIPAINYIAITAQGSPGADGKYRLRMPESEINKAIDMANKIDGIVILDIQVGFSTLKEELPLLKKYLSLPNVHLAIDPEFSMKGTEPPGRVIGSFSAEDINYAIDFLSDTVTENNLTPKILVVHRFTKKMVKDYKDITPTAQTQVVIDMDGWGTVERKKGTYNLVANQEPVQFTGYKIFYYNDLKAPSTGLTTPQQVLDLTPSPIFIQYQ